MLFSFWTSKNPGKALEKTVKQPWKTLDFWMFEDVRTLLFDPMSYSQWVKYQILYLFNWVIQVYDLCYKHVPLVDISTLPPTVI